MHPMKCVVWSPQGLDHFISPPFGFLTFNSNFHILGALVGSISFVELFVVEVFHEDLEQYQSTYACRSLSKFYDVFIVLCPMPWLFTSYNVFISRYFAALH